MLIVDYGSGSSEVFEGKGLLSCALIGVAFIENCRMAGGFDLEKTWVLRLYWDKPRLFFDNTDLPGFMLVVNVSLKCLCMVLSLSIDETDESAEMRTNIP